MNNKGTMEQKNKIVPELRFPEFVKDGEWEKKNFGELLNLLSDYTANGSFASLKENVTYYNDEEFAVLVRTTDLDKKDFMPARFTDKRGYDFLSKTSLFGNEIVMANVGSIGKVFRVPFYDKPMTLAPNTYVLKFNNFVDEDFIYQLMLRSEFENKLLSMVGSSTLMAINKANLRSIKITIPFKEEQQKIADCLSSLDELITAHNDKLETLKNHKKGLLQNLFPQENQKVPNYRFPEFVNDEEWIFEEFSKVYKFLVTNSYSRDNLNYENGDVKNIHYGDIHTKFSTLFDITKEEVPYLNLDIPISKIRQECYCKEGDVIFADASEDVIDIGKSIEVVNLNGEKLVSGLHTLLARQIEQKLVVGFAGYLFLTSEIRKQIQKESQGAKVLGISGTRLSNIKIYYPKNPKEQQKIADCLSAVDNLITAQTEKIEQLKAHKKGLMQGLFPKIEE